MRGFYGFSVKVVLWQGSVLYIKILCQGSLPSMCSVFRYYVFYVRDLLGLCEASMSGCYGFCVKVLCYVRGLCVLCNVSMCSLSGFYGFYVRVV